MTSDSPIGDGLRTAFRNPLIVMAEIAWRWAFGLAVLALVGGSFFAYLNTVPITNVEILALRSHVGWLVADAIGHILHASVPLLLRITAILLPAILLLWVAAASAGRAATLKALLRREEAVASKSMVGVSFLRASVRLASLIAYLGAFIVAGLAAARSGEIRPGILLAIFAVLAVIIGLVRSRVDWFWHLAAIFVVRDGDDAFTAVSRAARLFRRHTGACVIAGAVFGTIRVVLFAFVAISWLLVLSIAGRLPLAPTVVLFSAVTLAYFAVCDFLYIARLAAYVALDEHDRTPPSSVTDLVPPAPELAPKTESSPTDGPGLPSPDAATS
jgi:hypothetical protein